MIISEGRVQVEETVYDKVRIAGAKKENTPFCVYQESEQETAY